MEILDSENHQSSILSTQELSQLFIEKGKLQTYSKIRFLSTTMVEYSNYATWHQN